jgi:hypothetical protein
MRESYEMVMFKAASLKLGLDYAVMHNMTSASSAQQQLQLIREDIADFETQQAEGQGEGEEAEARKPAVSSKGRRGKGKKEIEGISLERAENYSSLSKRELENLLKHGAYDIFREEKDGTTAEETTKYYEADIDLILQVRPPLSQFRGLMNLPIEVSRSDA